MTEKELAQQIREGRYDYFCGKSGSHEKWYEDLLNKTPDKVLIGQYLEGYSAEEMQEIFGLDGGEREAVPYETAMEFCAITNSFQEWMECIDYPDMSYDRS